MREAVFGGNVRDIRLILANIVYTELLSRGYSITAVRVGTKEIDFVREKQEKCYIYRYAACLHPKRQSAASLAPIAAETTTFRNTFSILTNKT